MRINNNISAVITNKQLLGTENSLAASMERLASGLKINHAADNPSGMAIANKMRAQIKGLDQASRNSSDGTSVLQTVDGAMGEITSMVQRMRELAIQAANGTNSFSEKDSIQAEIASLRDEVDRIAGTTEFNTKSLLDGSLDARVYPDKESLEFVSRMSVSEFVSEGKYSFTVENAATQAGVQLNSSVDDLVGHSGVLNINGLPIEITETMTASDIYTAIRDGAERANCTIDENMTTTSKIIINSNDYGIHAELALSFSSEDASFLAADATTIPNLTSNPEAKPYVVYGVDAKVTLGEGFEATATITYEGNRLKITDNNGFKMDLLLEKGFENPAGNNGMVTLDVTDIGVMDLQVGANKGQTMRMRIPAMDAESLYLDTINVATNKGAIEALSRLDEVLDRINSARSQIGAYENRLDYTTESLDETSENMTAALSRIEDVDMAVEMTEYTKYNVLEQAGTSALAQANELPDLALQLLR